MSATTFRPEVYEVTHSALRGIFGYEVELPQPGQYCIAGTYGSFGYVCDVVGLFGYSYSLEEVAANVDKMFSNDLFYILNGLVSGDFANDYEIWHVVDAARDAVSEYSCTYYTVELCSVHGDGRLISHGAVFFDGEREAREFASRSCGFPYPVASVYGDVDGGQRLLHRYKAVTTSKAVC